MALRFFDGFDSVPNLVGNWVVSGGTVVSATGRDGVGKGISTNNGSGQVKVTLPAAYSTIIQGVAWNLPSGFGGITGVGYCITLFGDTGATAHLSVNFDAAGRIQLRRGSGSGTVIATTAGTPLLAGTWHYVEIKATIADSGGTCIVHLDNVEVINFTGDTKNAGTNTTIDAISLPGAINGIVDDFYVLDGVDGTTLGTPQALAFNDFLNDCTIKPQRPDGNGATSAWVGSDGNSTDNYLLVDEVPFSSTDYVGSSVATDRDLYEVADLVGSPTVYAVQVKAYAAKSDAGVRSFKTLTRSSGGTVAASAAIALSTSYTTYGGDITTKDPDGTAWTASSVNAAQFGVETA
jgi:hypothetical protein